MGGFVSKAKAVEKQPEQEPEVEQERNVKEKQIQSPIKGKRDKSTVTGRDEKPTQILSPSRPPSDLVFPYNGFRQKLQTTWSIDKK